jgi:nucleotide-binding universal stress UspA family protein
LKEEIVVQRFKEADKGMEGCVMLALSTFRRSEKAISLAMEKSRGTKKLMIVYVVDINVARYLIGADEDFLTAFKDQKESDLLTKAESEAREEAAKIAEKAERKGIQASVISKTGRFAVVCLEVVRQIRPALIVTTRSRRPEWVKKLFGAPVDELIAKAGCPVVAL